MNQKDTARPDEDDDIEMIRLEDKHSRPYTQLNMEESDSEHDDSDADGEDSAETLLGNTDRTRGRERPVHPPPQRWPQMKNIVIESAPTLLFTTVGLLFTGELLDHVSRWRAMREVQQLIMIIPAVLNLKGNLEMNLSARLGTAANVGELEDPVTRRSIIIGNLTLLQVQATVVSFIVACISSILTLLVPGLLPENTLPPTANVTAINIISGSTSNVTPVASALFLAARRPPLTYPSTGEQITPGFSTFVMVASTSMASACLSSIVLGSFMCALVLLCLRFNLDPDNIAPPIASCLGDLITLLFIGLTSSLLIPFIHIGSFPFFPFILIILIFFGATIALMYTARNPHVRPLIGEGWVPLFGAMAISTGTGIVLEKFVSRYEGFALLAVVISGLPGSVGSILVSRLSTSLHAAALTASLTPSTPFSAHHRSPSIHTLEHGGPLKPRKEPSIRLVTTTLLLVTIPIEVVFLGTIHALGWLHLPILFVAFAVLFFFCAVTISLFVARLLTTYLWSMGRDPDMYALPVHSALMDLVGQLLLVVCFEIAQAVGAIVRIATAGTG